jgi:WhiB family transcriptional regulator, redox-sensing transcriptional regulator
MTGDTWRLKAACRGQPTNWWFPEVGERVDERAAEICAACPVATECLAVSLWPLENGVWGGMGMRSRRRHREETSRPAKKPRR